MLSRCGEDVEYTMVDSLRVRYTITIDALDTPYKKISKMEDWDRRRSKRFPVRSKVENHSTRCMISLPQLHWMVFICVDLWMFLTPRMMKPYIKLWDDVRQ